MKKRLFLICFICGCLLGTAACTEKKKTKDQTVQPVEPDNGIGDGAPPLDSLLNESVDSLKQN